MKLFEIHLRISKPETKKSRKKNTEPLPKFTMELSCSFLMDAEEVEPGRWKAELGRIFTDTEFSFNVHVNNLPDFTYHASVICPENMVEFAADILMGRCAGTLRTLKDQFENMYMNLGALNSTGILSKNIIKRDAH